MNDPAQPLITDADAAAKLDVLRLLADHPNLSQRLLAQALGMSLGKTHYVLHALLDKGLLKIDNFNRSRNKVAYAYLLTPSGIRAKSRLTRDFLNQKLRQFESLSAEIDALRRETEAHKPALEPAPLRLTSGVGASSPTDTTHVVHGHKPSTPESQE